MYVIFLLTFLNLEIILYVGLETLAATLDFSMILGQNLKFRFCLLIVKMEQEMVYHDVLEGGVEEGRMEAANT